MWVRQVLQVLLALRFFATGCFQIVAGDLINVHKSTACRTIHRVARVLRNHVGMWVRQVLQVLLALRFFATGCFQIVAGDLINVHKSTACRTIHRVARVLRNRLDMWVRLPNQREANLHKTKFHTITGFPNVIGCMEGTHILIQAPVEHENEYVDRSGNHSINVKLVCDSDNIINCVVNYPGSGHDARIFTESQFCRDFDTLPWTVIGYMLGDSAYPLKEWLITTFINTNGAAAKERYNRSQSSTRQTIEWCNGVLNRRFHCLKSNFEHNPCISRAHACSIHGNYGGEGKVAQCISSGTSEAWAYFLQRWADYKKATHLAGTDIIFQLLECCDEDLRKDLTRTFGASSSCDEATVIKNIYSLAVRQENIMVARVQLNQIRQDHDEPVRAFATRLRGQAGVCNYGQALPSRKGVA